MKTFRTSVTSVVFTFSVLLLHSQGLRPCTGIDAKTNSKKWGFSDRFLSEVVIPTVYDTAIAFSEGLARVRLTGKYGFVNSAGKLVIPTVYEQVSDFSDGFALAWKDGRVFFIDQKGVNTFKKTYRNASAFSNRLALVWDEEGRKAGFINTKGELVIPQIYEKAFSFNGGLAPVKQDHENDFKVIGLKGETLFTLSETIKMVTGSYSGGMLVVALENETGKKTRYNMVNEKGAMVCKTSYASIQPFRNGHSVIAAELSSRPAGSQQFYNYGLVDQSGKEVVPPKYACLSETAIPGIYFYGKKAETMRTCSGYGLLDSTGKELTQPSFKNFTRINDTVFLCKEAGKAEAYSKYLLLHSNGKELLKQRFEGTEFNFCGSDTLLTLWTRGMSSDLHFSLYHIHKGVLKENISPGFYVYNQQRLIVMLNNPYLYNGTVMSSSGQVLEDSVQAETVHVSGRPVEYVPFILLKKRKDAAFRPYNLYSRKYVPLHFDFGKTSYEYDKKYSEGLLGVKQNQKWGFIDSTTKVKIPLVYEEVRDFHEGMAAVTKADKDGDNFMVYINKSGKELPGIRASYLNASDFSEGVAFYKKNYDAVRNFQDPSVYYINTTGKVIFTSSANDYFKHGKFSNGLAAVPDGKTRKYGYINTKGELAIPYLYDIPGKKDFPTMMEFKDNGTATVEKDGKMLVIDRKGNVVK